MCAGNEGAACWFGDVVVGGLCLERSEAVSGTDLKEEAGKEQRRDKAGQEEGGRVIAWGKKGGFLEGASL